MIIIIYTIIAFLLGIAFVQWIIPFLDGITNVFLTWLEVKKGALAVKITEYQKQTTEIKEECQQTKTSAIGFTVE